MKQILKTILTVVITMVVVAIVVYLIGGDKKESTLFDSKDFYDGYMEGCMETSVGLVDLGIAHDYCHCTFVELSRHDNKEIRGLVLDSLEDELSPKTAKIIVDVAIKCSDQIR